MTSLELASSPALPGFSLLAGDYAGSAHHGAARTGRAPNRPWTCAGAAPRAKATMLGEAIDFDFLLAEGMIAEDDLRLFSVVDSADEAIAVPRTFYQHHPPQ